MKPNFKVLYNYSSALSTKLLHLFARKILFFKEKDFFLLPGGEGSCPSLATYMPLFPNSAYSIKIASSTPQFIYFPFNF